MRGRPLTEEKYDSSRWIVEPFFHLYDCCQENDGAAALIVVPAEEARDFRQPPAYLLGSAQGSEYRNGARGHNAPMARQFRENMKAHGVKYAFQKRDSLFGNQYASAKGRDPD